MEVAKLERANVSALDEILGKKFNVLDDGFVRLVDYMGNDSSVVQAARVSYGDGTQKISQDRNLIRYLMRHRHTTPFEMCEIKLHVRVPMDCWRQWIRHRTANVNEYSTRYSQAIDSCQKTNPNEWRIQGKGNKQGSEGFLSQEDGEELSYLESEVHDHARNVYKYALSKGVAREQARKDLPLSTYTEAYWKIDLKNLLHFLALRMDSHAQQEIRDYASVIGEEIVSLWVPEVWAAFNDYHTMRNAMVLTAREVKIILLTKTVPVLAESQARDYGWLNKSKAGKLKRNRERSECETKMKRLGLVPIWLKQG